MDTTTRNNNNQTDDNSTNEINTYFFDNLNTIANIRNGDKLYIDNKTTPNNIKIDEPFMFQGIWRYCYNVSRKDAIYFINKLLGDVEIYINALYVKETDKNKKFSSNINQNRISSSLSSLIKLYIEKLTNTLYGIDNLIKTYDTDDETVKEFDKIKQKCTLITKSFENML